MWAGLTTFLEVILMSISVKRFFKLVLNFTMVYALLTFSSAFAQAPSSTWMQLNPSMSPSARDAMVMVYEPGQPQDHLVWWHRWVQVLERHVDF
jgi:hypothetical protein